MSATPWGLKAERYWDAKLLEQIRQPLSALPGLGCWTPSLLDRSPRTIQRVSGRNGQQRHRRNTCPSKYRPLFEKHYTKVEISRTLVEYDSDSGDDENLTLSHKLGDVSEDKDT